VIVVALRPSLLVSKHEVIGGRVMEENETCKGAEDGVCRESESSVTGE
jgi:hypothetical protein